LKSVSNVDRPHSASGGAGSRAARGRSRLKRDEPGLATAGLAVAMRQDDSIYDGLAGFRFALRQFLAFSEVIAAAAGVTSRQYQAMLVIKTHPERAISIKALAEQMLLLPNGAVQLVDRLAAAELVERRPSPTDGRSVLVSLTAKGAQLLEQLAADHARELLDQEPLLAESLRRLRQIGR
jgi:DNA-binding MarR family transcriptional regulator